MAYINHRMPIRKAAADRDATASTLRTFSLENRLLDQLVDNSANIRKIARIAYQALQEVDLISQQQPSIFIWFTPEEDRCLLIGLSKGPPLFPDQDIADELHSLLQTPLRSSVKMDLPSHDEVILASLNALRYFLKWGHLHAY